MKTAVTSLTSLVLVGCATAPTQADRGTLGANLDTLLRTAVGQKRVPGVVAAVATGDGIAYEGPASMSKVGFGFAL